MCIFAFDGLLNLQRSRITDIFYGVHLMIYGIFRSEIGVTSNSSPLKIILWCYGEIAKADYCQNITDSLLAAKKTTLINVNPGDMFL